MRRDALMLLVVSLVVSAHAYAQTPVPAIAIPRPDLFFGATNPNITPGNINQNICNKAWSTRSIRPPASYTTALKKTQLQSLGYTLPNPLPNAKKASGKTAVPSIAKCIPRSSNPSCYEEDHLIPLELGGDPRSPDNLWPEPWFGPWNAHDKDQLENTLHKLVCAGQVPLRDAQHAIATDWVGTYQKYMGTP